jgi:acetolactate synthase-1/2/3 large subunit
LLKIAKYQPERHLQTIGIKEADHSQIAMKEADLIVAVGYDLVEYSPKNWNRDTCR